MPSSLFRNNNQPTQQSTQKSQQVPQLDPRIQSMIEAAKRGQSPQSAIQSMIFAKNPQAMQAIQFASSFGGDFRTAFYKMAAQKGVDPNSILSMFN